jgi:CheY-like chemotaxis protein
VFGVVKAHQGFIEVESEPGKGSTFKLYFPLPARIIVQAQEAAPSEEDIALVITDLGLPKLDGWEVFKRVREINPGVAVLLASGYVDRDLKQQILESGVKGFLQKPYRPEELLLTVRKALD